MASSQRAERRHDPYAELERLPEHLSAIFVALYFDKWSGTDQTFLRVHKREIARKDRSVFLGQLMDLERRGLVECKRVGASGTYRWKAAV